MGRVRTVFARTLIVLGVIVTSLVTASPAHAAVINVTSSFDTAPNGCTASQCTLREAIAKAEQTPILDTVVLQTRSTHTLDDLRGALVVTTPIEIRGPLATIEGETGFADNIFDVSGSGDLRIATRTTITGGNVAPTAGSLDDGGAFMVEGKLVLANVTVKDNVAADAGGAIGGGSSSDVTISDSVFERNTADGFNGGAIDAFGDIRVTRTRFTENTAGLDGGAIRFSHGAGETASVVGSIFERNKAGRDGGGIGLSSAEPLTVSRSTFTDNDALGEVASTGDGGGIVAALNTDLAVDTSTFSGNTALRRGGGIFSRGDLAVSRSTIAANDATGITTHPANGGGIAHEVGAFSLANSTLSGNTAEDFGGGLNTATNDVSNSITNSTITLNIANVGGTDTDGAGGGTAVSGSATQVAGSIIFGNISDGTGDPEQNCAGGIATQGGNVLTSGGFCAPGAEDSSDDPSLGPLANNGGSGETHAITSSSVAQNLNGVDGVCGGTDQRGAPRPNDVGCDSGAYELVFCRALTVNVVGTNGADRLTGTPAADGVLAQSGADTINSGGGNDKVCSGAGNDLINGGSGNDQVFGEAGADTLGGGAGNDLLDGGPQADRCVGGPGTDRFRGCETTKQ